VLALRFDDVIAIPFKKGPAAKARVEMPLSISMFGGPNGHGVRIASGAIIVGNLKYIIGNVGPGVHFNEYYPMNATRPPANDKGCPPPGCLYDIIADPGEFNDLSAAQPTDLKRLTDALDAYIPTLFQSDRVADNNGTYDCVNCLNKARGYYAKATGQAWFGPWL